MFFTHQKIETLRMAIAEGCIRMAPETLKRLKEKTTPKGDAIEMARTAGVMAAKKTSELIPYCHPLPLDGVHLDFAFQENEVKITSKVITLWKTGVEMEALCAVNIALLTLYDMLKPIDKEMMIHSIRLTDKKGGKSSYQEKIPENFKAAVLVTSDGTFQKTREDKSGKIILEKLESYGLKNIEYCILPDDKKLITEKLQKWCNQNFHLILTTGGTGLGPRDFTTEATKEVIDREIPGIAEAMRQFGQKRTPYAMLSRGLAGLKNKTLILNLPGSSKGTQESLDALFPALFHSYKMMSGGGH